MGKKIRLPCLDVIMIAFFLFSIRNMVFHCIFLGKKAIIIASKHGTRIFFPMFHVIPCYPIIFPCSLTTSKRRDHSIPSSVEIK